MGSNFALTLPTPISLSSLMASPTTLPSFSELFYSSTSPALNQRVHLFPPKMDPSVLFYGLFLCNIISGIVVAVFSLKRKQNRETEKFRLFCLYTFMFKRKDENRSEIWAVRSEFLNCKGGYSSTG